MPAVVPRRAASRLCPANFVIECAMFRGDVKQALMRGYLGLGGSKSLDVRERVVAALAMASTAVRSSPSEISWAAAAFDWTKVPREV